MAQTKAEAKSKVAELEGNELADYARTHLPKGRWGDTWDLFKNNFVKFVIINVFTLLFFVPGITVVIFRMSYIAQMGLVYPLSVNALFAYPVLSNTMGMAEHVVLMADLLFYSLLIAAGLIASVGVAGASYSIKKLINTHGQFSLKGYFHGVKVCYLSVAFPITIFMVFMFGSLCVSDWTAYKVASGAKAGGPVTAKVFMIIGTVLAGIILAWILAVSVSYNVKPGYLIKNSFILLIGTVFQTVFMLGFALIPVWLLLIGTKVRFFLIVGLIFFIFIGFSFILLCWLAYTQWVFDMFVTPAIAREEDIRKSKLSPKELAAEKEAEEKAAARELLAAGKSELVGRPLRPIKGGTVVEELGVTYGRADIARVADDRKKIQGELDEYYEKHKSDTKYVEYERLFAEREKALTTTDKKGKKKKVSQNNLLTRR